MTNHKAVSDEGIMQSWPTNPQSANADLLNELVAMFSRSRDLQRNNGIATSIIETIIDKAIGPGLTLTPQIDAKTLGLSDDDAKLWNEEVERQWTLFTRSKDFDVSGRCDFAEACRLKLRTILLNGESLALVHWNKSPLAMFKTQVQLVEADRLSTPENKEENPNILGGIEVDKFNRPVAYYISKEYPGDNYLGQCLNYQRLPIKTDFGRKRVIHVYKQERIDQARGKPLLAPVLAMFKKLDMYSDAELTAAVVSAVVAMIVTTEGGTAEEIAKSLGIEDPTQVLDLKKNWPRNPANGKIINLFPGESLETFTPNRPNSAYSDFVESILREICVTTGLSYEVIMKDFSKCNYSSARASLQESWEKIHSIRAWFVQAWVKEVYSLFIEEIANRGLIQAPDFYEKKEAYLKFAVHGPTKGVLDPGKEAKAATERLNNGTSTYQKECAMNGDNWEDVFLQQKKEQEITEEKGIKRNTLVSVIEDENEKEQTND